MNYHTLFFPKLGKRSQNLSSAAVAIGSLMVSKVNPDFNCTLIQKSKCMHNTDASG